MEKLLHYVWKHKIFPLRALLTPYSEEVEVLDVGLSNPNSGPDFFNAKIKIGDTLWAGNVELHMRSSDWFKHGHDGDAARGEHHRLRNICRKREKNTAIAIGHTRPSGALLQRIVHHGRLSPLSSDN